MEGPKEKTLIHKLGIKPFSKVCFILAPKGYAELLGIMPEGVKFISSGKEFDLVQFFANSQEEFLKKLPILKKRIKQNGCIWICWQKAGGTDLNENFIREFSVANGLVDIKVIAIDSVWSGLKLVIPVHLRIR
jgi:hypothetical protein